MKQYTWTTDAVCNKRRPDFENLRRVLLGQKPHRKTLFEFFLNDPLEELLAGRPKPAGEVEGLVHKMDAFAAAGYDYCTVQASDIAFDVKKTKQTKQTVSLNDDVAITSEADFEAYPWPDPEAFYNGRLERLAPHVPEGMKLMVAGPCGVLENAIRLLGYDNMCYMLADEPALVEAVFHAVGQRLYRYYRMIADYDIVGVIMVNDDWGFKTQTMLSTEDMRRLVVPWHQKIVEAAHQAGKPAILHSCGNLANVFDDIVDVIGFDGKHSYEDAILPVEEAYTQYKGKIAVLGGIDLDYMCRKSPEEIYARASRLLELGKDGGYALGTGNSVPAYVPTENYLAMLAAAL